RSLRDEMPGMRESIETAIALRKLVSHKQKKLNDDEYEQALNSPSMLVLYEQYKEAVAEASGLSKLVQEKKMKFHNKYGYFKEEDHLEAYAMQEQWAKASLR